MKHSGFWFWRRMQRHRKGSLAANDVDERVSVFPGICGVGLLRQAHLRIEAPRPSWHARYIKPSQA